MAAPVHPVLTEGLEANGYSCVFHENISQEAAYELIKDCTGVITSTRLQLNRELIDAAPMLSWIGRMGSGMEVMDVAYATAKGIACYSSPEGNCNAVGEHALGMLLTLMHRITWSNMEMKQGIWQREENRGTELEGKTVGIIGFGHTGSAFARKLQGFDVRILAYDKYNDAGIHDPVVNCKSLDVIFEEADIVSFHVPLQEDTIHYLNDTFVSNMRKAFILINTSRGGVVDTAIMKKGLAERKIKGACLDVFEVEPPAGSMSVQRGLMNDVMALPNVVVTPHIAGYTFEALYKMSLVLLHKITSYK